MQMYRLPPTNRQTTKLTIIYIIFLLLDLQIVVLLLCMVNTYPKQKVQQKYHVLDARADVCEIVHASTVHCYGHVYNAVVRFTVDK